MAGVCAVLLVTLLAHGTVDARAARPSNPALWIVADRIVGFVPFTVYVYGQVNGLVPGRMELCGSELAWLTESGAAPRGGGARPVTYDPQRDTVLQQEVGCAAGRLTRTPDGYDYAHTMTFTRPGTYQVRLMMVDGEGDRVVSNALQVNAF